MLFPSAFLVDMSETCYINSETSRFDSINLWKVLYERLKNRSTLVNNGVSCDAARSIHNRWKNRYRDISPYDNNRVILRTAVDGDYINASYVNVPDVPTRKFILTQGPMQQTASHFWLMVWECRSPIIVMLNRIYEKGVMRCFPYFPNLDGPSILTFEDVSLRVRLEQEINMQFFTRRTFELTHLQSNDQHHVIQMHYTNWPDFGVPSSPSGILNFLWAVRATGSLSDTLHPSVVHCSAGVGRSGAFVLIDLALQQVELQGSMDNLDLSRLFIDLRRCRMGVIQTSDQLRFCYTAIARAADELLRTPTDQIPYIKFQPQEDEDKLSTECSNSDDSWDGVNKDECGFSTEDSADSDDEVQLTESHHKTIEAVDSGCPIHHEITKDESLDLFNEIPTEGIRKRFSEPDGGPISRHSWLPSNLQPVYSVSDVGSLSPSARNFGQSCEEITSSSTGFFSSRFSDQSNNASIFESASILTRSYSYDSMEQISYPPIQNKSCLNLNVDDGALPDTSEQPGVAESFTNSAVEFDDTQSEYLAEVYDRIRRRELRRQRQVRMHERVEQTRQRMRELDLERKRYLPRRILHMLRRFYCESGWIQNRYGAILSTAALLLLIVGCTRVAYTYWNA